MNDRAIVYRRKYGIPAEWGTAVNVQLYLNTGKEAGSGVGLKRIRLAEKSSLRGVLTDAQGKMLSQECVHFVRLPS